MASSVFSTNWYRIATLHPILKSHVGLNRHVYRNEVWWVLQDAATGKQHRLNHHAYAIVGRMTGKRTMQQIWEQVVDEFGDAAPTQPEVIELLAKLHQNELVRTEVTPNITELFRTRTERQRKERTSRLNPFAFRVTLFDPDTLLGKLAPLGRVILQPWVAVLWLLGIMYALSSVATHWVELQAYASSHLTTPRMILVMWLAYPLLKALHELAHGVALKAWGGESHDFGVTLMLLMPVPYIDCSSAAGFSERGRRVAVSLMGIVVELGVAALALGVWLIASEGLLKDIAFALMIIGGVSTVLFNANPLMKFDGYHALADVLEIPGLAQRGAQLVDFKIKRHLLGAKDAQRPSYLKHERVWLVGYAVCSWVYKLVVSLGIVQWLLGVSVALSALVAAWFLVAVIALPLVRLGVYAWRNQEVRRSRVRAILAYSLTLGALVYLGVFFPIPNVTSAQGIVWLPEQSRLRATGDGFVSHVYVTDGQAVRAGQAILQLEDPDVSSERDKLTARHQGLKANYMATMVKNAAQAALIAEDIYRVEAELARNEQKLQQLRLLATVDGKVVLPQPQNLVGKFYGKGALISHVVPGNEWEVRVVLSQNNVSEVQQRTQGVTVRALQSDTQPIAASLKKQTPSAVRELPSPLLGDRAGGSFVTDPNDQQGLKTLDPVFVLDLSVPGKRLERLGERVHVRFDHGQSTLAQVWSRRVHQVFLKALGADRNSIASL